MRKINLKNAHNVGRGNGVRVAVIDTGIDLNHPLFAGRLVGPYYDFIDNDGDPIDEMGGIGSGHGTFVAGLIALVAPDAMILPLRVFDRNGEATSFNVARAIRYAADNGARVINLSFGLLEEDKIIKSALDYAYKKAFLVAPAGNSSKNMLEYPAMHVDKVFSVAASTNMDILAKFSNYHRLVDLASPGDGVYSAFPGGQWARWSGTSFSTAAVAGGGALLPGLNPSLNPGHTLHHRLRNSGVEIRKLYQPIHKNGMRLDLYRAVMEVMQSDDDDECDDRD